MFHIRSTRLTVDSKIGENRCKQKYELIQVMGILYRYITLTAYIDRYTDVSKMQNNRTIPHCIFSILSICWVNRVFYTLSHLY